MTDSAEQTQDEEDAEITAACRGAPAWITPDAVRDTLQVFRPFYKQRITVLDALEILINTGNLFAFLDEGNQKRLSAEAKK